jgi:hypothetical protein
MLEPLRSLRPLRQQLVALQGVPAKDLDRPSHRRHLVVALCCRGRVQVSACDRKHGIAECGQAAHDVAADIQPHDERRAYDAQHHGCDDGERAEFHHPQRLSVCVINFLARAGYQTVDSGGQLFREVGILAEKLRGILRERELKPAQRRHAACPHRVRPQLGERVGHQ